MKKILSLTLSFLLVSQNVLYAQSVPNYKNVEEVFNKVSQRVNSSFLNQIAEENQTTPLTILAAVSSAFTIETKADFAAFLKKMKIKADPSASVIDLSEAALSRLKELRTIDRTAVDYLAKTKAEAIYKLSEAYTLEPRLAEIFDEYVEAEKHSKIIKEFNKLNMKGVTISRQSPNLNVAKKNFYDICNKVGMTPKEVISYYKNMTQIPEVMQKIMDDYILLMDLTADLFAYRGEYEALKEIESLYEVEGVTDLSDILYKYTKNLREAEKIYYEVLDKIPPEEILFENPVMMSSAEIDELRYRAEDLHFKYVHNASKLETLQKEIYEEAGVFNKFTKKGGLFIGIIALFALTDKIIKDNDIKQNVISNNKVQEDLQDFLSDNFLNLFPILELLPEKEQKFAFNFIAENYYDTFINQAGNLLFSLSILEKSASKDADDKITKELDRQFDKNYKIIKEQLDSSLGS